VGVRVESTNLPGRREDVDSVERQPVAPVHAEVGGGEVVGVPVGRGPMAGSLIYLLGFF
jgi:hypothetical protein